MGRCVSGEKKSLHVLTTHGSVYLLDHVWGDCISLTVDGAFSYDDNV